MKPVEFVPVSMAMLLWSVALLEVFMWWIFQFYVYIETDNVTLGFQGAIGVIATVLTFLLPAFLVAIPAQFYFGILHMREVLKLKQQTTSFSIREADCSCCAMHLGSWEDLLKFSGMKYSNSSYAYQHLQQCGFQGSKTLKPDPGLDLKNNIIVIIIVVILLLLLLLLLQLLL